MLLARYFKPVFNPTKNKNFNSEFYNSTEKAYHYQNRQISLYVDSTLTQANQMFYIHYRHQQQLSPGNLAKRPFNFKIILPSREFFLDAKLRQTEIIAKAYRKVNRRTCV